MVNDMTPDDLKSRTKKFAVDVIRFAKAIPKDHINDELASQLADAATSVLAIVALAGGRYFGAGWLDPTMGLVGAVLVGRWALSLLRDTGRVLLDAEMDAPVVQEVRDVVAALPGAPRLHDLHVWRVGKGKFACIVSLGAGDELRSDEVREALSVHGELVHVTIEIDRRP